jgi:hypothetical protein
MTTYNMNAGEAVHEGRRFRPTGPLRVHHAGAVENPVSRVGGGGYSARLFVGLNVGQKQTYTEDDVVAIVWRVRKKQKRDASATILAQKGIYEDFRGERVIEPSVQVILIDMAGTPKKKFVEEMKELAEELRSKMKQETVILEIQRRGVSTDVFSATRE